MNLGIIVVMSCTWLGTLQHASVIQPCKLHYYQSVCFTCVDDDDPNPYIRLMLRDEVHGQGLCEWPVVHILMHFGARGSRVRVHTDQ